MMGIDNIDDLKPPAQIHDMENYIRSRQRKGKSAGDIRADLIREGYDVHAAQAFIYQYWE